MAELERSEVLHRNPVTQQGFTMIPNAVLTASRLSCGARMLYGLLKMHAWQADNAFPGQERLAGYLGVSTRQVRTYQTELEDAGLITIEQRGLRQTNRYWIEDIPAAFLSDRNSTSDQDRNPASDQDRNSTSDKEDSAVKKTQKEEESTPAQATRDISPEAPEPAGRYIKLRKDLPPIKPVPKPSDDPAVLDLYTTIKALPFPTRDGKIHSPKRAQEAIAALSRPERDRLLIGARHYVAAYAAGISDDRPKDLHNWIGDLDYGEWQEPAAPPARPLRLVSNGSPVPAPLPRLTREYLQAQKGH